MGTKVFAVPPNLAQCARSSPPARHALNGRSRRGLPGAIAFGPRCSGVIPLALPPPDFHPLPARCVGICRALPIGAIMNKSIIAKLPAKIKGRRKFNAPFLHFSTLLRTPQGRSCKQSTLSTELSTEISPISRLKPEFSTLSPNSSCVCIHFSPATAAGDEQLSTTSVCFLAFFA